MLFAAAELCGNGVVDGGEDCDQANLDGETCVTQASAGGTLACSAGCSFDTGGCYAVTQRLRRNNPAAVGSDRLLSKFARRSALSPRVVDAEAPLG